MTSTPGDLYPWQRDALAAWKTNGSIGVVEAVTGAGKTRIGILAIEEALDDKQATVVVVPTTVLLRQWEDRVRTTLGLQPRLAGDGHDGRPAPGTVLITTVQTACRRPARFAAAGGLLVADEVHRYGAPTFSAALSDDFGWRLGLTATYERSDDGLEERLMPYFGGDPVFSLNYRRALDEGVIAPFRVALLRLRLGMRDQQRYDIATKNAGKARYSLVVDYGVPPEPFGEFMAATAKLAGLRERRAASATARRFLKAFTEAQRIIAENQAKLTAVRELAPLVEEAERTLVFSSTIRGAQLAAEALGSGTSGLPVGLITSEQDSNARDRTLRDFEAGRLSVVSAPLVLDEGVDVPEADLGIVVASTRSRRQMIQRLGRVLRLKPNGGHAKFILLVATGTSEDPTRGAHGEFLQEMLDAADAVREFTQVEADALSRFLVDGEEGGSPIRRPQHEQPDETQRALRAAIQERGPLTTPMLARLIHQPTDTTTELLESGPFEFRDHRWHLQP